MFAYTNFYQSERETPVTEEIKSNIIKKLEELETPNIYETRSLRDIIEAEYNISDRCANYFRFSLPYEKKELMYLYGLNVVKDEDGEEISPDKFLKNGKIWGSSFNDDSHKDIKTIEDGLQLGVKDKVVKRNKT